MTRHTVTVPADLDGERADRIVAAALDIARGISRAAFDDGSVTLDGVPIKPSHRLTTGGVVEVTLLEDDTDIEPDDAVPFQVLFEDREVVVVDKPIGVVVHPTSPRSDGTLVHGLIARYPEIRGVGERGRWGIVHRLDRDTSGVLVVARTAEAHARLSHMIRQRTVVRRYLALARGTFDSARGTIEAPIGRTPRNPTRMRLDRAGRPATTHYRRTAAWDAPDVTLLDVTLETGRTHQIRVHLEAIDRPIIGDTVYGVVGGPADPGRPWLHARHLEFRHPSSGETVAVTAPLAGDLVDSLAAIGPPDRGAVPAEEGAT